MEDRARLAVVSPSAAANALPEPLPDVTKIVHVPALPRWTTRHYAVAFVRSPDGRDAALRLFQYALRLALTFQGRTRRRKTHERLLAVVSLLAAIRRVAALHRLLSSVLSLARGRTSLPALPAKLSLLPDESKAPIPSAEAAGGGKPLLDSDWLDVAARVACQSLDVAALVAGNVYLFSRLGLVPLSVRTSHRSDKISDWATLAAAGVGLASIARKRNELYRLGKQARRRAIEAESKLDELDFWESRVGRVTAAAAAATEPADSTRPEAVDGSMLTDLAAERVQLRDRVRAERKTLRALKLDLGELWWERLRLGADGLFALYDALEVSLASESVKSLAGITSAAIE
ncbi:hypothetical protein JCM3774_001682 [Rhodotorula dairenensis]